jgi:hypothetical protein
MMGGRWVWGGVSVDAELFLGVCFGVGCEYKNEFKLMDLGDVHDVV